MDMDLRIISPWLFAPLVYLASVLAMLILKRIIFRKIKRLAIKTATRIDDVVLEAIDFPVLLIILVNGAFVAQRWLPLDVQLQLAPQLSNMFKAVTIVAAVLFVERFATGFLRHNAERIKILQTTGGIAEGIIRIVVVALGALVLFDSFGISVTPILASLGLGSLAVALALQPTLENFFAGIQLITDQPVQVGHFVKLESGEEGYVTQIGWRSTWIKMPPNNTVIIPNKIIVNGRLLNYYYPDKEVALPIEVGVHYGSDLEKVERVTLDVARQIMKNSTGGVPHFEPAMRFHTFGDSSIGFCIILRVKEVMEMGLVRHEFIKALHKRYAQEGIVIPYPIRAVNYDQEKAFSVQS